jgi:nucleotide-binding universal stress UspA family protein
MRYLVAVDGWDPSHRALTFAAEQTVVADATLDVVHVVDVDGGDESSREEVERRVAEQLADVDVEYDLRFPTTDLGARPANEVGDRLVEYADEHDYDAVYVGNEENSTAERAIVGSVARTLVEARSVPVVLVP